MNYRLTSLLICGDWSVCGEPSTCCFANRRLEQLAGHHSWWIFSPTAAKEVRVTPLALLWFYPLAPHPFPLAIPLHPSHRWSLQDLWGSSHGFWCISCCEQWSGHRSCDCDGQKCWCRRLHCSPHPLLQAWELWPGESGEGEMKKCVAAHVWVQPLSSFVHVLMGGTGDEGVGSEV